MEERDRKDDDGEDATDEGADDNSGVDSEAGGSPLVVLASRLQTGQNVLHDDSNKSTHCA